MPPPDGAIWKMATSSRKDGGPASRDIDGVVLLLAASDVSASRKFYVEHGLKVGRSFGSYVDFAAPSEKGDNTPSVRAFLAPIADVVSAEKGVVAA